MSGSARVIIDERERRSGVPNILKSLGIGVEYTNLAIGDYIITSGYVVERKTVHDFVNSLFSGRLFNQVERLSEVYKEPIVVVEGDLLGVSNSLANPRVIWGAIITLAFDYYARIFFTGDRQQTANLLYVLASHKGTRTKPHIYRKMKARTPEEEKLNLLVSLPGIGPKLSKRLLTYFGSVRKVFSASVAELTMIEGIGRVKADKIVQLLDSQALSERRIGLQSKLAALGRT